MTVRDRVKFNIRGTTFEVGSNTFEGLLQLSDESKFMIEEAEKEGATRQEVFLERDPACFTALLRFCQHGSLHLPSGVCPKVFQDEMEIWGVELSHLENCCYNVMVTFVEDTAVLKNFEKGFPFNKPSGVPITLSTWQTVRYKIWNITEKPFSSRLAKIYFFASLTFLTLSLFSMVVSTHPAFRRSMNRDEWKEALGDDFDYHEAFLEDYFDFHGDDRSSIANASSGHRVRKRSAGDEDEGTAGTDPGWYHRPGSQLPTDTGGDSSSSGSSSNNSSAVEEEQQERRSSPTPPTGRGPAENDPPRQREDDSIRDSVAGDLPGGGGRRIKRAAPPGSSTWDPQSSSSSAVSFSSSTDSADAHYYDYTDSSTVHVPPKNLQDYHARLDFLDYFDYACFAFFTVDFVVRLTTCPRLSRFFCQLLNVADLLALLAGLTKILLDKMLPSEKYTVSSLDAIDCLQVFRFLRFFRLLRDIVGFKVLVHSFKASTYELLLLVTFLSSGVLVFSTLVFWCERKHFGSIPEAFWWAIITMTTVGYGDMVPKSSLGKVVGSLCAISGVILIAITIPILVNNFLLFYGYSKVIEARQEEATKARLRNKWKDVMPIIRMNGGSGGGTRVTVRPVHADKGDLGGE